MRSSNNLIVEKQSKQLQLSKFKSFSRKVLQVINVKSALANPKQKKYKLEISSVKI